MSNGGLNMKITKSQLKEIIKEALSDTEKSTLQAVTSQIQVYVEDTGPIDLNSTVQELLTQIASDLTE